MRVPIVYAILCLLLLPAYQTMDAPLSGSACKLSNGIEFKSQWVQSTNAVASDNARAVIGAPDNQYWSLIRSSSNLRDSLEILIENNTCVSGITIIGNITTIGIYALLPSGTWDELWSETSPYVRRDGNLVFSPTLAAVNYTTNKLKLDFVPDRLSVDAIQVFGTSACAGVTSQWVHSATSEDADVGKVVGASDGKPWIPVRSGPSDSLNITIQNNICISGIVIYEYRITGRTVGISALSPSDTWDPLWTGNSRYVFFDGELTFSPTLAAVNYTTNKFKVDFEESPSDGQDWATYSYRYSQELERMNAMQWNRPSVDAIQLFGTSTCAPVHCLL